MTLLRSSARSGRYLGVVCESYLMRTSQDIWFVVRRVSTVPNCSCGRDLTIFTRVVAETRLYCFHFQLWSRLDYFHASGGRDETVLFSLPVVVET